MINKRGYTLVEVCIAMLIMMVIICATMPLLTSRKLQIGTDKYSQLCIVKDNGNILSQNCVNSISLMKGTSTNNSCNNLTYYVQSGTANQKTAALKVLQEACSQGAEAACDYFISLCVSDNTKCNINDPPSGLHKFLTLNRQSDNLGKLYIEKALKDYYNDGIVNIVNEINTSCSDCYAYNAACNVKKYGTGSCTCGSASGSIMTNGTVKVGFINGYNLCTTSYDENNNSWNNGSSSWINLHAYSSDGYVNSAFILQQNDSATPYLAAIACNNHIESGHSDWYLPSIQELALMNTSKAQIGNFDSSGLYWSSTENAASQAYYLNFSDNTTNVDSKNISHKIRCVRRDY